MKSSPPHRLHDDIAIVGWACRLPGANSVDALWSMLLEGRCAVTRVPEDRFPLHRFGHPRRQERGKSYSWAAGVLDDVWGFDPTVFGISPREAAQLDPQQRILLQLTWEALEDAGIRPSSIAGSDAGVYVGASQTDYGHAFFGDPAVADAHFAPGTALAVLANRISYIYGLHGPSITVDTACSSSLVALNQAVEALRSGRIDTAIVAGCNLIASPASFIAFSQANMLSATGLCQAFSAQADGFVRAEGAVTLVLRRVGEARARLNPIRGLVLATDVNSDGRTNGISLPNLEAQEGLLERVYRQGGIDPDRLAFVEAHGTGTPVGDPVEATAIGRVVGRERSTPLPIGSIKTNIGHLEPASGLAGLLKAVLALNHEVLPPSLHFKEPNPHIEFDALNLSVCARPLLLPKAGEQLAGVNSFGFGGTNAHAVVGPGIKSKADGLEGTSNRRVFALSAKSRDALTDLARDCKERVGRLSDAETAAVAGGLIHRRERLPTRLVVSSTKAGEVGRALGAFISGRNDPALTTGTAVGEDLPVAFVFSGNGGQFVGMGQAAYEGSPAFRARFDEVDGYFRQVGGWSPKEALFGDNLEERLPLTSVAQPLIFSIQAASTAALRAAGLRPAAVFGHSVGEVAAAEAAGVLDLRTAVEVIHARSTLQERIHGTGRMAAVLASAEAVEALLAEVEGVEIGAINSPRSVTVAGEAAQIARFMRLARSRGVASLDLDLEYPFHTELMAPVHEPLLAELADIRARDASVPFISTVAGACVPGSSLGGEYWWHNVREPVRFSAAVEAAAELGIRYFVEVGPRPTLLRHINETLRGKVTDFTAKAVLDRSDEEGDPFERARATAIVAGADVELEQIFGPDPGPAVDLPRYPWQQTPFRFKHTTEALGSDPEIHPFAGTRDRLDTPVWRSHVDPDLLPVLADHVVGGQTIFPGTGLVEIATAVARQWLESDQVLISDFEIFSPLDLTSGETREVMTRVSPGSGTGEILSRPRLSQASWLLHVRFKFQTGNPAEVVRVPDAPSSGDILDADAVYGLAEESGLHYGPAFRLVERVTVHDETYISVELAPPNGETPFVLDPMRLDAGAHGFFTLFPGLRAAERGVAYIPVRLDEVALFRPHAQPVRTLIEVTSRSERSVVGNCYVLDADGTLVAALRGVRSRPISIRRTGSVESVAFVEAPALLDGSVLDRTGVPVDAEAVAKASRALASGTGSEATVGDAEMLLDGWATVAAYELASSLARGGTVDLRALSTDGTMPDELREWVLNLLVRLEAADLASQEDEVWSLVPDPDLPPSETVAAALAKEHPERASEALLAAAVSGFARALSAGEVELSREAIVSRVTRDFHTTTNVDVREASALLRDLLVRRDETWPDDRALRVLMVGSAPLAHEMAVSGRNVRLTVLEADRRRHEMADITLSRLAGVSLVDADGTDGLGEFDLIVAVSGLHRLSRDFDLKALRKRLATDGLLVAVEPTPSLFKDLVSGLEPGWFGRGASGRPASPLLAEDHWVRRLEDAGFADSRVETVRIGEDQACLIVAGAASEGDEPAVAEAAEEGVEASVHRLVVAPGGPDGLANALTHALSGEQGDDPVTVSLLAGAHDLPESDQELVVLLPPALEDVDEPVTALTRRCLTIRDVAAKLEGTSTPLWLVFHGALSADGSSVNPVETGAWAFSRTLANEHSKLDVRRIDVAPDLDPEVAARRIRRVVTSGTRETELHVDADTVRAVRVTGLRRTLETRAPSRRMAVRLERQSSAGQRVAWTPVERRRPGEGEVEIEVDGVGLNFRDLMWSMSLLPEDMLEDGFSGASLGLECAGRVARVGPGVKDLEVGDPVMAFAASAFASHVTVDQGQAVKLPGEMDTTAAATIPVAFFTAYYSLVTQAKLSRGEWVLIHGGAGGVGMAAIQIAQARRAKIIATAGSPAKRNLLRALGVTHVLDSRSTNFADQVRDITGVGVDVVLNSLAGEAMERSIACLRPFGRFVELGKRDYALNTHVGLRPFRKNLTYFGVDVDQVVGARPGVYRQVFKRILKEFEKGRYLPLPHSVFDGESVTTAFHLMQQSGHVGKIVVRPPSRAPAAPERKKFSVRAKGTHVITGAFGGFGLEAARWLVDKGARHLVLIGRRGAATPEAEAAVREFQEQGVQVLAEPCDITDRQALGRLLETARTSMPPVVGVLHAAMVLDDGVLANLDEERFHRVLAPKVLGAENLDRLLRGVKLDYFVLFSSVTTLVGNPGQANYVAANAYMEGLARRRRQKGLPALAVGWGPIVDVGVLARNEQLQAGLEKLTGVSGMRARDALGLMEQALEQTTAIPETAVMTIAPVEGSVGADRLAVLKSPTYEAYLGKGGRAGEGSREAIDIPALAAKVGVEAARQKVADVITTELAQVLHLREEDISPMRPLAEIGLDSLMALELVMKLEDAFGMRAPFQGASGGLTVTAIADEIMAHVGLGSDGEGGMAAALAGQHHGDVEPGQLEALKELVAEEGETAKRLRA